MILRPAETKNGQFWVNKVAKTTTTLVKHGGGGMDGQGY